MLKELKYSNDAQLELTFEFMSEIIIIILVTFSIHQNVNNCQKKKVQLIY